MNAFKARELLEKYRIQLAPNGEISDFVASEIEFDFESGGDCYFTCLWKSLKDGTVINPAIRICVSSDGEIAVVPDD